MPRSVIKRALNSRRDLLSMHFDPMAEQGLRPEMSIAALELRSVVCVPLVQIRSGGSEDTRITTAAEATVGLLYMDSRDAPADLSAGNRELLQTLAIEASTILENARLFEEERKKIRIEDELKIARTIQQGLLPARCRPPDGSAPRVPAFPRRRLAAIISMSGKCRPTCGPPWWPMFRVKASAPRCWPACCKVRS